MAGHLFAEGLSVWSKKMGCDMKNDMIWPLGIAASLGLFVAFLIGFLVFSTSVPVNLVNQEYYQNGVDYQQQIERVERTAALEAPIGLKYNDLNQNLRLEVPGTLQGKEINGKITVLRPSNAEQDVSWNLQFDPAGVQDISLSHLQKGMWRAQMFWSADGQDYYQEKMLMISL